MSKRGGKRGCVCLIPNLSGKALNFSPFSMMLAVRFSQMLFIRLMKFPSLPSLLTKSRKANTKEYASVPCPKLLVPIALNEFLLLFS